MTDIAVVIMWAVVIAAVVVGIPTIAVIRRRRITANLVSAIKTRSTMKSVEMVEVKCPSCKEVFYHGTIGRPN